MLSTANVSIQFGAKPLFEQVSVKFADGNRYGLIGANGSGKSTFMKILGGELDQSSGEVMLQTGLRLGKLNQNQFGYEDERVLDVVMQGHVEMWHAMKERDLIYADAHASDADYMHAAELEAKFAEYGGWGRRGEREYRTHSILDRRRELRHSREPCHTREGYAIARSKSPELATPPRLETEPARTRRCARYARPLNGVKTTKMTAHASTK
jgi:ATPase subunit of ABC transporter with duplicated ATPase domains